MSVKKINTTDIYILGNDHKHTIIDGNLPNELFLGWAKWSRLDILEAADIFSSSNDKFPYVSTEDIPSTIYVLADLECWFKSIQVDGVETLYYILPFGAVQEQAEELGIDLEEEIPV